MDCIVPQSPLECREGLRNFGVVEKESRASRRLQQQHAACMKTGTESEDDFRARQESNFPKQNSDGFRRRETKTKTYSTKATHREEKGNKENSRHAPSPLISAWAVAKIRSSAPNTNDLRPNIFMAGACIEGQNYSQCCFQTFVDSLRLNPFSSWLLASVFPSCLHGRHKQSFVPEVIINPSQSSTYLVKSDLSIPV